MREESPFAKVLHEWSSGGLANAIASAILNPIDVVKTRLQALSPTDNPHTIIRIRPIIQSIWQESGVIGLWKPGLAASMTREMLNSGPRAGFYVPIRDSLQDLRGESADSQSWSTKLLAALTTGQSPSSSLTTEDYTNICEDGCIGRNYWLLDIESH